jgi:acetate kinase
VVIFSAFNAGSSSIKFEAFEVIPRDELQLVFRGHFQGIGSGLT